MIPTSGPAVPENPPLVLPGDSAALKDTVNPATRLVANRAFNINSTGKNAWNAFLACCAPLPAPAGGGTFMAYGVNDDPSGLRVDNLSSYRIRMRFDGRLDKQFATRDTLISRRDQLAGCKR